MTTHSRPIVPSVLLDNMAAELHFKGLLDKKVTPMTLLNRAGWYSHKDATGQVRHAVSITLMAGKEPLEMSSEPRELHSLFPYEPKHNKKLAEFVTGKLSPIILRAGCPAIIRHPASLLADACMITMGTIEAPTLGQFIARERQLLEDTGLVQYAQDCQALVDFVTALTKEG